MSDIYVINCILTSDQNSKSTYILSDNQTDIILPFFRIENPRFIYNQIRYDIKNLFVSKQRLPEEILVSFIEVENDFLIEYVEKNKQYPIDLNKDIVVLCGIILGFKDDSKLHWKKYEFNLDTKNSNPLQSIVDHTIQKSL